MKLKFLGIATILFSMTAQAWDDGGHLLIGEIAARQLRPEVIQKMEVLLPLLDTQFNGGHPYNLVTAGVWLDDLRGLGKDYPWKTWHYVDVPCEGNVFVEPAPPHALWALDQAVDVLRSKTADPKAKAEALGQVLHLVGDIHQPIHAADRNDAGGNRVRIAPITGEEGKGPTNLHAFWDVIYRYDAHDGMLSELWKYPSVGLRPPGINAPGTISEQASFFLQNCPKPAVLVVSKRPWLEWAKETHALACASGWPKETPDATGTVHLSPVFIHHAHEASMQQIVKAGLRLGSLLNELLGESQPELQRR